MHSSLKIKETNVVKVYNTTTSSSSVADPSLYTSEKDTKLNGIQAGATQNDTDANLKNRANHTGSQAASTITQDSTHRFVTDTEKSSWSSKIDTSALVSYVSNSSDTFGGVKITQIVSLTQAQYDGISSPVSTTLYIITD